MVLRPSLTSAARLRLRSAFSLIEVTLAIGLLAVCLVPLMGLLPTGLNAQRSATESATASNTLAMLATAVRSSQFVSRDVTGAVTFRLPQYFSDSTTAATTPTTYITGQIPSTHAYAILDDGSIRKTGDSTPARQTLFVKFYPPATDAQLASPPLGATVVPSAAVRVYALVAWPALPTDSATTTVAQLKNRQGTIESFITYVPTY